jgi:pyruvate dehydrogenase E1 component
VMNENYVQRPLPDGATEGVLHGMYRLRASALGGERVQLFGSGAILPQVLQAADRLEDQHELAVDVWSITSYSELAREAQDSERQGRTSWLRRQLAGHPGPIIAATDYVRAVPDQIRAWLPHDRHYLTLGTDGFGRSDTRTALRAHFGVDAATIVARTLQAIGRLSS